MTRKTQFLAHALILPLACAAVPAAAEDDLEQFQTQLHELRQRYQQESAALRDLEARLRQMELQLRASLQKAGKLPAAATAGDAAPAPDRTRVADQVRDGAGPGTPEAKSRAGQTRGVEALLKEEHAVFDRRLTVEAGISYARSDRAQLNLSGFLALDSIFLGTMNVDTVKADSLTFDLTARYGLTDRLQVDFNAPFLYRRTVFQSGGVNGASNVLGEGQVTLDPELSDISAGFYYELLRETPSFPSVVWSLRAKAPTGKHPYGIPTREVPSSNGNLQIPERLASGTGLWAVSTGLSIVRTVDPALLFANVSFFHNFPRHFNDIFSNPGAQPGDVDQGNSFQYGLGTAFALSERTSLNFSYSQRFTRKTRTRQDGGDWVSIVGSEGNAAVFNVGLTHALSDRMSLVSSVGIGLTPDAPDVQFNLRFPYSF